MKALHQHNQSIWKFVLISDKNHEKSNPNYPSIIMSASFLQAAAEGMGWYDQDIWKNENRAFLWYPDAKKPRQTRQSQPQNTPVRNELAEFEMLQKIWMSRVKLPS